MARRIWEPISLQERGCQDQSIIVAEWWSVPACVGRSAKTWLRGGPFARKGREEGREEGQAREAAEAVVDVFEARGIAVSDEVRDRIMTCKDLEQLRRWRRRAVVAGSVGEIFEV